MKFFCKVCSIFFLAALLHVQARPVCARALLGISYPETSKRAPAQEVSLAQQMEEAFGNLITIHNYNDKTTLLNMLTKFNKLDAALISEKTYKRQDSKKLTSLAEVQISGGAEPSTLVLVARFDMSEAQQNELLQGYQELLLSTGGLELLEHYAKGPASPYKRVPRLPAPVVVASVKTEKKNRILAAPSGKTPPVGETTKDIILEKKPVTSVAKTSAAKPVKTVASEPVRTANTAQSEKTRQQVAATTINQPQKPTTKEAESKVQTPQPKTGKNKPWAPHIDLKGKFGNDRSLGEMDVFVPVMQDLASMLFLDLRFQLDDESSKEGNFGLGYRKIIDSKWILGGYGFYDRRESAEDNDFQQLTLGVEALTEDYDARLNIYLAEDKDYLTGKQESLDQVIYSEFSLIYQTGGTDSETREKAMSGFDAEIGWLLPWFKQQEVRGYLGGYHFTASDVKDISGPRGRFEIRFPDIFGWAGSLFELGGEVRHDSVRDTDYFLSARGRIPFGSTKQSIGEYRTGIHKRMTERVQRDPDIVIGRWKESSSSPVNNEVLTENGSDITLTHVDSQSTGGDGSFEEPYASLAAASSSGSSVVLLHADSVFNAEGIALSANQRLLGEGTNHSINTDQLGRIDLPKASSGTATPAIQNVVGTAIELADGVEVSGIEITGATTGIYGSGVGGVNINRNNIINVDAGIHLDGLTPHARATEISRNTIRNTQNDGIYIYNDDVTGVASANVTNNQLQTLGLSGDFGAGIFFQNEGQDLRVSASGNTITGSYEEGIIGLNASLGTSFSAILIDNHVENAGTDGVAFINVGAGNTLDLYLQDNYVDGDITNGSTDYFIENLGSTFNLGATAGNPFIGSTSPGTDKGVIASEGNTRADRSTAPFVDAFGQISIVDKTTIPTP